MENRLQSLISEAREAETSARAFTRFARTRTHTHTHTHPANEPFKESGVCAEADRKRPQHRTLTHTPLNLCTNKVSCTSVNPHIPLISSTRCAPGAGELTSTPFSNHIHYPILVPIVALILTLIRRSRITHSRSEHFVTY